MAPQHDRLGPYRVSHVLGSGGMGVVYAARDERDGRPAAVKVARVHPASRRALELEIEALSRLSHPGIVRFLDHGSEDGLVWVATELVVGRPLRDHVDSTHPSTVSGAVSTVLMEDLTGPADPVTAGGERLRWPREVLLETLALFRRLCSPLAWLHGEGLVHGDVKPENVLVREDGSIVLVDFGLFRTFAAEGREVLPTSRKIAGTAAYLSPEQCRGEAPDARSDLYAVGCMLYEWLTGRPPFGKTPYAIRQHVEAPVPPITDFAEVPEPLEAIVTALLEKSPRRRTGYATDLAEALERLGVPPDPNPGPPPRRALYRAALVGRDRERAAAAHPAGGRAAVVVGEEGVGRTRLLAALVERGDDVPVLAADARAPGGVVRALLRGLAVRCRDEETARRWFGGSASVLVAIEPELAALPGIGAQARPEPTAASAALGREVVAVARAIAAAAPLRLVVDDLHLADERDQAVVLELVRRAAPAVWVTTSAAAGHPLVERLRTAGAAVVALGPLDDAAMDELVGDTLALASLPAELRAFVHERAGGNPRFACEVLRLLVDEGHLVRRAGRWVVAGRDDLAALPIPAGAAEVALRRWATLSAEDRAAVEQAAIAGPATLPDRDLARLRRAGVLEVDGAAIRWVVPALRERAIAELAPERRRALHELALATLPAGAPAADRAAHLEGAGRLDEARAAWSAARIEAQGTGRWGEVLRCAERLLALPGVPATGRLDARIARVGALRMRGRWAEAVAEAEAALADAAGADPAAILRCRVERARALSRAGRPAEARAALEELAVGTRGAVRATVLEALAETLSEAGDLPPAVGARRAVVALRQALGGGVALAEAQVALANVLQRQDRSAEAQALLDLALPVIRAEGRALWKANALATQALVAGSRGDEPVAEAAAREAAATCRRLGMLASEAQVLGVLAESLRRQGRRSDCLEVLDEMEALAAEVGAPRLASAVAYNRAMVEVAFGGADPIGALLRSVEVARAASHGQVEGVAALHAAQLLRKAGRWEEALPLLDRVDALAAQRADRGFAFLVATERGHHALQAGGDGRAELARAEGLLARIPDAGDDYRQLLDELRAAVTAAR